MEQCTFTWTDEAGVGIGLNAVSEEWVDDGRDEALEFCPICLHEWDMDVDEAFDEYVANSIIKKIKVIFSHEKRNE